MQSSITRSYLSHPPMRPPHKATQRQMNAGAAKFVDAARGSDAGDGAEHSPWKTVTHALDRLAPGETLYLRGGIYYEHIYLARVGREDAPITIRSYPGEVAIIDGGFREFFESPRESWEPAPGNVPDYFRSTKPYLNARYVLGHFADSMVGLLTYYHREDIEEPARTLYENQSPRESYPMPVYLGPGVWHDAESGHIYCRLSHTNYNFTQPGTGDYKGARDPRQLPLVLAGYGSLPLFLDGATHVNLQDLVIRGAGEDAVKLRGCHHITFDNVTIYCGTYGLHSRSSGCVKIIRSAMYGSVPPWHVHCGQSLRVYDMHAKLPSGKPPTRDVCRLNTHVLMAIEGRTEEQVDYCVPGNHNWEMAYSDFTDSLDGVHFGGFGVKFHHNRIDRCQDDSIYLTPLTPGSMGGEIQIYNNLFTRVLLAIGFGGLSEPPAVPISIYRNVIDQRCPFLWSHHYEAYNHAFVGHFRGPFHFGQLHIYQNTFISHMNPKLSRTTNQECDRTYAQSSLAFTEPGVPRRVFNNLYVYVEGMIGPREETLPLLSEDVQINGNVHHDLVNPSRSAAKLETFRKSDYFEKSKSLCAPGWEANSRVGDARFASFDADPWQRNDYRLREGSAAIAAGVELPKEWADPMRPAEGKKPDVGAMPLGAEPFRAGREMDEEALKIYEWLEKSPQDRKF